MASVASATNLKTIIQQLINKQSLAVAACEEAMDAIAHGRVDPLQVAAFLVALRAKGETKEEVEAIVRVMRRHYTAVSHVDAANGGAPVPLLDIVGTGGDGAHTVNLSTAAAIVAAASGAIVGKHGNRSVSSKAGSADVLEVLGVEMLAPDGIAPCLARCGIAFMFAPKFHPAMRHVVPVRRALGVRTVFNILGPLLNPAGAQRLCLGVFDPALLPVYGHVLHALGVERALVVHCCGLDELAPIGTAQAVEVTREGGVVAREIDCVGGAMGIPKCTIADLRGGSKEVNAGIIRGVLAGGSGAEGPIADTIALNAGAGLYVYGSAATIAEGYATAKRVLASGAALATLDKWAATTQELASRKRAKVDGGGGGAAN